MFHKLRSLGFKTVLLVGKYIQMVIMVHDVTVDYYSMCSRSLQQIDVKETGL